MPPATPSSAPSPPPHPSRRRRWGIAGVLAVLYVAVLSPLAFVERWPLVSGFARAALLGVVVLAAAGLGVLLWRRLLWRVGRRLAFSYFLVGVLPIGLLAVLLLLASYLLGGFLLGHLYRDAMDDLGDDLETAAQVRLDSRSGEADVPFGSGRLRFVEYRGGQAVGNPGEAPQLWPSWLEPPSEALRTDPGHEAADRMFVALADGTITAGAVAGDAGDGILAWFDGDLAARLRARTLTWFEVFRSDDPEATPVTRVEIAGRVLSFRGLGLRADSEAAAEFRRLTGVAEGESPAWLDRPTVQWVEKTATPVRALATGEAAVDFVSVSLAASPRGLFRSLLSSSEQADSTAWIALGGLSILLLEIWIAAAGMALFMIIGLSRAVNRLSRATEAVGRGDFTVRISARRRDQLGALQRSFNDMTEHLDELVATAAQKEALDKELALARTVQEDLLPDLLEGVTGVELASTFEPSAAIGGDYYDVFRRPSDTLALVVADVAGHGLAAGLRMAMVKSALTLLVEEERPALETMRRLRRLLKPKPGERGFVTLCFAEFDPATGELTITNAGHPPAYLVRAGGEVAELAFPGTPLGTLEGDPGRGGARLEAGDCVVWLSDGVAECRSPAGETFGYDRIASALSGPVDSAEALQRRLLDELARHCGAAPTEDDKTVLVLRYVPEPETSPSRS